MLAGLITGLGAGAVIGGLLGKTSVWYGVAALVIGIVIRFAGSRERDTSPKAESAAETGPRLPELGTRVEQILRLAEEQAEDHRRQGRREAERIVAEARQEAARIVPPPPATSI